MKEILAVMNTTLHYSSLLTQKKKTTNKISAVNYAYGFFVLECIPIVAQNKKKVSQKNDANLSPTR